MAEYAGPTFVRAMQPNGTISSICRRCLRTVANRPDDIDLRKLEDAHTCRDLRVSGMYYPDTPKDAQD